MEIQSSLHMKTLLAEIDQADGEQLNEIEQAVIRRYEKLFPGWEMASLSLPKNNPKERKRIMELAAKMLERQ